PRDVFNTVASLRPVSESTSSNHEYIFFFLIIPRLPRYTLFPYTTLFRSQLQQIQLWRIRPGLILSLLYQMVGQVCRVQQYGFVFDQNPVRATLEQYLGILQQQLPR